MGQPLNLFHFPAEEPARSRWVCGALSDEQVNLLIRRWLERNESLRHRPYNRADGDPLIEWLEEDLGINVERLEDISQADFGRILEALE